MANVSALAGTWTDRAQQLLSDLIKEQGTNISTAAQWCADSILKDGVVHLFGTGHSRIPIEEMFPRYGSYAGFNPMGELSTTFHTQVVGSNGQRQAMYIERVEGFAAEILKNWQFNKNDILMVFSVGGKTAVPIEMA
ncbi:MAG: SIS domain-containing protein, partial [Actinobacteria bacterium]|nr:SIS domain-containing protein [Actinomycetota bacterium]